VAHKLGRSFALTEALVKERRNGALLCLHGGAIGQSFRLSVERPSGFEVLAAYDDGTEALEGPELAASRTGVAVVRTIGVICQRAEWGECGDGFVEGYDTLAERFIAAHAAEEAGAVVLVLDGPGGDVAGLDQAVIRMAAAAVASGKQTLVYIDEAAFSAHYRIAVGLATGGIFLPPSGKVGSIGCMSWHVDYSGANALAGQVVTYFSAPAGKVAGNPDEPLSDLARARRQATVDEYGATFAVAVAAARGLTTEGVLAFDGAIFVGQAAVDAGLADGLATFEEVVSLAAARASASAAASLPIAPEPSSTTIAPAPAARAAASTVRATKGPSMKLSPALHALLPGLAADASEAAVEAAVLPRLVSLAAILGAVGESNHGAAVGTVKALASDAAEVPALRAKVAALDVAAEHAERVELLEGAIEQGKYTAGDVWDSREPTAAELQAQPGIKVVKMLAATFGPVNADGVGMTLPALRANVARKSKSALGADTAKADESTEANQTALVALTPQQRAFARVTNVDPTKLAALLAVNFPTSAAPAAES
jgi:ClpP class serine protease